MKKWLPAGLVLAIVFRVAFAQDSAAVQGQTAQASGKTKMLLTGYTFSTFRLDKDHSTFGTYALSEMLLYTLAKNLFVEGEVEFSVANGSMETSLEHANICYFVSPYLVLKAGKFSSPLGTFTQLLHPAWINRSPSFALGFEDNKGWGPEMEVGAEAIGATALLDAKLNYAVFISNGPRLVLDSGLAGTLDYENLVDNNRNKAVGGRIGFLPFSNSSLEIGIAGEFALVGDEKDSAYQNTWAQLYAFDLSYVKALDLISGVIDIKGQLNLINVDKAGFANPGDATMYTFNNRSSAYYAQFSFRPSMVKNKILRSIEWVGRYGAYSLPKGSPWEESATQFDLGVDYWIGWRTVLKAFYEQTMNKSAPNTTNRGLLVQAATGF